MERELTQQDLTQPAGVVSVREVLSYFDSDRFFSKAEVSDYLSCSTRSIEKNLHLIPHYRLLNSMLRFRKSEIDEWTAQFREGGDSLDRIVDETLEALNK